MENWPSWVAIVIQLVILGIGWGVVKHQADSTEKMLGTERQERINQNKRIEDLIAAETKARSEWQANQRVCPINGDCPGIFAQLKSDASYIRGKIDQFLADQKK
jgi:hypothetical protein